MTMMPIRLNTASPEQTPESRPATRRRQAARTDGTASGTEARNGCGTRQAASS